MNVIHKSLFLVFIMVCSFLFSQKVTAQTQFIQNKGQWNKKVNYRADFSTGSFFLENKGFSVLLHKSEDLLLVGNYIHGTLPTKENKSVVTEKITLHSAAYNVSFLGANAAAPQVPDKVSVTYNNYFIGNNENDWASNCKIYGAVTYKNIYPNIDVRYYTENENLKYDFIVKPGGNPAAIALRYDGVTSLNIKNKQLVIGTDVATVTELAPYSYQAGDKQTTEVNTGFVVRDNVVTFNVGKYDPKTTLIIDPQIIFATLTGSPTDNWGYTATPGADGSFFAGGIVFGSGYPVSPGAFQTQYGGGNAGANNGVDMGIFKFSADGSTRVYATYIGGSGDEQPHSMITDANNNLIIAGRSNSSNYPLRTGIPATGNNFDIVITKLNAAGSALIGSIKIGGSSDDGVNIRPKYDGSRGAESLRRNYGDDARSEVILDNANNVYLASCTQSSNFPVSVGAAQTAIGGAQDGVILKLSPNLNNVIFSTFFGGNADDACFVAAINPITQELFIGGATSSNNLRGSTTGTVNPNFLGDIDGFVTTLSASGNAFLKTTYIGTGAKDLVYGLKFDKLGFPYVMGTTLSGSWPRVSATFYDNGAKQFIAKLKTDLSSYVYSTVFGKNTPDPSISPIAFLVDRCENVYVSGWGGGININQNYSTGNTSGLTEVNPLAPIPNADGQDFYFFVLRKDATSQLFGSHFGEDGSPVPGYTGDHVDGGTSRFDANGVIYQAICANCGGRVARPQVNFPATANAYARLNGGSGCNQGSVKISMDFAGIGSEVQSSIDGVVSDTFGCIPLTVNFKDLQRKGVKYYWNFNSQGNPSATDTITTSPEAIKIFDLVGTYRVRLISEDSSTCNIRDTSYITITAGNNEAKLNFTRAKLAPCESSNYQFKNLSFSTLGSNFIPTSFVWDYGDGSPLDTSGIEDRFHSFPGPGTYFVKLTIIDPRFCNTPDTLIDTLRVNPLVVAIPKNIALGCVGDSIVFENNSLAGLSWYWNFGDPASGSANESTLFQPTHVYNTAGTYTYYLVAYDSTTCNKIDTSDFITITILEQPTALFTWAPNPPEANVPVRFTNLSSFADTYFWEFGDGETSTEFAPVHEYNATGRYQAKLTASNKAGCAASFVLPVDVIVNPLLDVPNAFTPGRFGVNSVVNVRGFGIGKMDWKIYNRWGQLVFQSGNKRQGWDGTFKGKLQPIDVYTYTLDVEFTDGKKLRKTGDITLLR